MPVFTMMNGSFDTLLKEVLDRRERRIAATVLGSLPKKERKQWSGWIGGHHYWRGRLVILPDGKVGRVYGAVRGRVAVQWNNPFALHPVQAAIFHAHDLRIYQLPAAVLLGKAKAGVRERPSALKAVTSRANGFAPPKPGSRLRGRPRLHTALAVV